MLFGELALDGALAGGEPVHGVVEGVNLGVLNGEQRGEGGLAGGADLAFDAELGAGLEEAADDHGEGEGALAAGYGRACGRAGAGGRCRGWRRGGGRCRDKRGRSHSPGELVLEGELEEVDGVLGEGGEIGEGAFLHLVVLPVGFAEEMAGRAAEEGGGTVHE